MFHVPYSPPVRLAWLGLAWLVAVLLLALDVWLVMCVSACVCVRICDVDTFCVQQAMTHTQQTLPTVIQHVRDIIYAQAEAEADADAEAGVEQPATS